MRRIVILAALALAACAPEVPDSAAGMGAGSYSDYLRAREAQLQGRVPAAGPGPVSPGWPLDAAPGPVAPPPAVATAPLGSPLPPADPAAPLLPPLPPADPAAPLLPPVAADPAAPGTTAPGTTALSDEQDFDAVAGRETIQSDAERRLAQQAQRVVVPPAPVPQRTGPAGPNVVEYALSTRHAPGTPLFSRFPIRLRSPEAACAPFPSADRAQEAFLAAGGPARDPRGLDPDGDGFACGWDPRPFRAAVQ